jgi:DNA modification methylase
MDPFFGTGTVGLVAQELDRDWLGIELNPDFARMAEERLGLAPRLGAPATATVHRLPGAGQAEPKDLAA